MGRQPQISVEERASIETIEKGKLKELFHIKSNRTIDSYIKRDVFKPVGNAPRFDPFDVALFDREHICKVLGLETLPDEPFLTTEEALPIIKLPVNYKKGSIRKYCDIHKIPYYILENAKGTKTYFLKSELEGLMSYKARWGTEFPDYVAKNSILREMFKCLINPPFINTLSEIQKNIITQVFINGKNMREVCTIINKDYRYTNSTFNRVCKKVLHKVKSIDFNLSRLEELAKENVKLESENNILNSKLEYFVDYTTPVQSENVDVISKSFTEYNFNPRVLGILHRMEAKNLYDLCKFKRSDVSKFQNAGKKSIDFLEDLLRKNGLDWKKETDLEEILVSKVIKKKVYNRTILTDVKTRLEEIEKKQHFKK